MNNGITKTVALTGAFVFLLLLSCAKIPVLDSSDKEEADVSAAVRQARRYHAAGDYQKALEVMSGVYAEYPQNLSVKDSYVGIIEKLRRKADLALKNRRVAAAGDIYGVLLKNSFQYSGLAASLSFDGELLRTRIKTCSDILYKSGLMKYREGKLDEAVSIWNKILVFDPENKEARNVTDTAKRQLKQLENIPR